MSNIIHHWKLEESRFGVPVWRNLATGEKSVDPPSGYESEEPVSFAEFFGDAEWEYFASRMPSGGWESYTRKDQRQGWKRRSRSGKGWDYRDTPPLTADQAHAKIQPKIGKKYSAKEAKDLHRELASMDRKELLSLQQKFGVKGGRTQEEKAQKIHQQAISPSLDLVKRHINGLLNDKDKADPTNAISSVIDRMGFKDQSKFAKSLGIDGVDSDEMAKKLVENYRGKQEQLKDEEPKPEEAKPEEEKSQEQPAEEKPQEEEPKPEPAKSPLGQDVEKQFSAIEPGSENKVTIYGAEITRGEFDTDVYTAHYDGKTRVDTGDGMRKWLAERASSDTTGQKTEGKPAENVENRETGSDNRTPSDTKPAENQTANQDKKPPHLQTLKEYASENAQKNYLDPINKRLEAEPDNEKLKEHQKYWEDQVKNPTNEGLLNESKNWHQHYVEEAIKNGQKAETFDYPNLDKEAKYQPSKADLSGGNGANLTPKVFDSIDKSDLSQEHKDKYRREFHQSTYNMPKNALDLIEKHAKNFNFYGDKKKMVESIIDQSRKKFVDTGIYKDREKFEAQAKQIMSSAKYVGGAFAVEDMHLDGGLDDEDGAVNFDGKYSTENKGKMTEHEIYAHELTHAIDGKREDNLEKGKLSSTLEWLNIHKTELGGNLDYSSTPGHQFPLTKYAGSLPHEGFAEFGRIVYGNKYSLDQVERDFPKASNYFKSHGIWPESKSEPKEGWEKSYQDIFEKRIDIGPDGSHADIMKPERANSLSKQEEQPKEEAKPAEEDRMEAIPVEDDNWLTRKEEKPQNAPVDQQWPFNPNAEKPAHVRQAEVDHYHKIGSEALAKAYGYAPAPKGNFGHVANQESAKAALNLIDKGETDIEKIASAVHDGWAKAAKDWASGDESSKEYQDRFHATPFSKADPKKQKSRADQASKSYDQLSEEEKQTDRVAARAYLKEYLGEDYKDDVTQPERKPEEDPETSLSKEDSKFRDTPLTDHSVHDWKQVKDKMNSNELHGSEAKRWQSHWQEMADKYRESDPAKTKMAQENYDKLESYERSPAQGETEKLKGSLSQDQLHSIRTAPKHLKDPIIKMHNMINDGFNPNLHEAEHLVPIKIKAALSKLSPEEQKEIAKRVTGRSLTPDDKPKDIIAEPIIRRWISERMRQGIKGGVAFEDIPQRPTSGKGKASKAKSPSENVKQNSIKNYENLLNMKPQDGETEEQHAKKLEQLFEGQFKKTMTKPVLEQIAKSQGLETAGRTGPELRRDLLNNLHPNINATIPERAKRARKPKQLSKLDKSQGQVTPTENKPVLEQIADKKPEDNSSKDFISKPNKSVLEKAEKINVVSSKNHNGEENQWVKKRSGDYDFRFTTKTGQRYLVTGTKTKINGRNGLKIDFENRDIAFDNDKNSFGVSGTGSAFEVIRTVVPSIVSLLSKEKPYGITFTAKEKSRQDLYDKIIKSTADSMGGDYVAQSRVGQDGKQYSIIKNPIKGQGQASPTENKPVETNTKPKPTKQAKTKQPKNNASGQDVSRKAQKPLVKKTPANQGDLINEISREAQQKDLHDSMGAGRGVNIKDIGIDEATAAKFDGHGTDLKGLANILNGGINNSKFFHSERLDSKNNGGYSLLKDANHFVVIGHPGQPITSGGVNAVIVDGNHTSSIRNLRAAFPGVKFIPAEIAHGMLSEMARKNPSGKVEYSNKTGGKNQKNSSPTPSKNASNSQSSDSKENNEEDIPLAEPIDFGTSEHAKKDHPHTKTPQFKNWFGDWEKDPENASKIVDPDSGKPIRLFHGTHSDFGEFDASKGHSASDKIGSWFADNPEFSNTRNQQIDEVHQTLQNFSPEERQGFESRHGDKWKDEIGKAKTVPVFLNIRKPAILQNREDVDSFAAKHMVVSDGDLDKALSSSDDPNLSWIKGTANYKERYKKDPEFRKDVNDRLLYVRSVAPHVSGYVKKAFTDNGYDGIVIDNDQDHGKSYVAFHPHQIKSASGNSGAYDPKDKRIDFSE